ncbi:MAG: excinuclease ABC subunit UvrB [Candidatus Marinimicrobia bacterium]|nr:excinuclease ABC subunit UvrB [Candidatus Neomarinimicrobiota bacterium]|tara:strand:+ start:19 stop:2010 length:1992 start_codon:yes stop_codon:yes gene_type:complete
MAEFKLHSQFKPMGDQPEAIKQLSEGVMRGDRDQVLLGITGSGKTFTMANVIEKVQKPTLILSHNKTLAAQLYGEFKALFPENAVEFFISYYDYYQPEAYLPVTDTFIEKDLSMDEEIDRLRLKATTSLIGRQDVIIIASVSCIYGIGSPDSYRAMLVQVYKGQTLDQKSYLKDLVNIHYNRNDMVLEPGTFRVRGDVIEVFPKYDQFAVRIELFGDEVEAIYSFNVLTGERLQVFDEFWVYPARHFVTSRENLHRAMDDIRGELIPRLEQLREDGNLLEAQRLEQRTFYDLEMMSELGYCSGIENYSMHLEGRKPGERPSTLIDFFPDDFLMFADESHVSIPQIRGMYNGDRARKINLVEHGFRLPSAMDNRPMKFEEFDESINQLIYVSATPSDYELEKCGGVIVEQVLRPTGLLDPKIVLRPTEGQIDDLIGEVRKVVANNERVLITTLTKRMAEDLTDYLKGVNIRAEYMHSDIKTVERVSILRGLRMQEFDVLVGINLLREGLDLPEVSLVIVLDADKEGFLRSKSSLLQVSGRAARNVNGRVILYGDKITASMQNLIDETDRRFKIQSEYNKNNGITPKTIYKSVDEIKLTTAVADAKGEYIAEAKLNIDVSTLDGMETKEILEQLKRKMQKCAKELQFEQAAILRDEIEKIEGTLK